MNNRRAQHARSTNKWALKRHRAVSAKEAPSIFSKLLGIGLNVLNTFWGILIECSKYFLGHFD
jgi:hypothetical protein